MAEYKVFVGGLSWNTDDDTLYKAFEPHGTIPFSRVCTDRETGACESSIGLVQLN